MTKQFISGIFDIPDDKSAEQVLPEGTLVLKQETGRANIRIIEIIPAHADIDLDNEDPKVVLGYTRAGERFIEDIYGKLTKTQQAYVTGLIDKADGLLNDILKTTETFEK